MNDLNDKLGNLALAAPQTPQRAVKAGAPTPKRTGRSSKSKAARIALAQAAEREDFTQALLDVSSDEDDTSANATPSRPSKSRPKAAIPILSLDGWTMPYIAPTSADEEAAMMSNMSSEQAADAEGTFVNRLQVSEDATSK